MSAAPLVIKRAPTLCLDFDGVLHSYTSGWEGANVVSDPPVPGAIPFLLSAVEHFEVNIFSSRSNQDGGVAAMREWLYRHIAAHLIEVQHVGVLEALDLAHDLALGGRSRFPCLYFPSVKPPALVAIDDRAITFTGEWPSIEALLAFQPWNVPAAKTAE